MSDEPNKPLVFLIAGPPGVGKTSVVAEFIKRGNDRRKRVITTTSRPVRGNERHGIDYFFRQAWHFKRMIDDGLFLEWVTNYGHYYGTERNVFDWARSTSGTDTIVLTLDPVGARKILAKVPDAVVIFLLPFSFQELETRLRGRGEDSDEAIAERLKCAYDEISAYSIADYTVFNLNLQDTVSKLEAIEQAERARRERNARAIEGLLRQQQPGLPQP